MMEKPKGVWCVSYREYGLLSTSVFTSEADALRAIVARGYGEAVFVPHGQTLSALRDLGESGGTKYGRQI